jgi:replicative DNA helicase
MVQASIETIPSSVQLPNNLEAERALLGALTLDNRRIDEALERIPSDALRQTRLAEGEASRAWRPSRRGETIEPLFFSAAHQMIFSAILRLHDQNVGVDLTILAESLLTRGQLELVGGAPYLAGLEDDVFALSQMSQYADIVVQKWRLRCLIRTCQTTIEEATRSDEPAAAVIDRAEKRIFDVSLAQQSPDFVHAKDVLPDLLLQIEERAKGIRTMPGLPTGFPRLDRMLNGLRPGQLVILAARPSMGKSAFALNIAANIALRHARPVGIFTLEMSKQELLNRLIATEAKTPLERLLGREGPSREQLDAIHQAAARIDAAPLYIDEASTLTALEMRARARRLRSRCPDLGLIVVDYLQLMTSGSRSDNRQQEVSEISRSLKVLAGELKIPVIALSQLSRESEKRRGTKDRLPRLSDLRDSGAIEQDADVVIFIHRERAPETREIQAHRGLPEPEEAIVRIGKHRNGPVGNIEMLFRGAFTEFVDLALED